MKETQRWKHRKRGKAVSQFLFNAPSTAIKAKRNETKEKRKRCSPVEDVTIATPTDWAENNGHALRSLGFCRSVRLDFQRLFPLYFHMYHVVIPMHLCMLQRKKAILTS